MNRKNKGPFFDKKYLSRVLSYTAVMLFAVGMILYLGFHLSGSVKHGIDVMYARCEYISRSVDSQAYIIRDEVPIDYSVGEYYLSPSLADGSKVRVGMKLADVYTGASSVTQAKINLIEDQIAFYERCRSTHLSVGDTSSVDNSITSSVISLRRAAENGDAVSAASLKQSIVLDIRKLGVLTGRVSDYSAQIASLNAELTSLKQSLGSVVGTVYAPASGYYFSTTDGYEEVFSSSQIESVTYSDVIAMIDKASGTSAEPGSAGKIVNSFKWYIACPMSTGEASRYTVDASYDVKLQNNASREVSMKLSRVLTSGSDAVALFECSVMPADFDYTRTQNCEIRYEEVKGFKIPVSAVRMYDGYEGVYILDEITVDFRRISVIEEENGYYLCEAVTDEAPDTSAETSNDAESGAEEKAYYPYLRENDVVITSGTGLYVGMTYNP